MELDFINSILCNGKEMSKSFYRPKEEAREYFVEYIKNADNFTTQEIIALIGNSRKIVKEYTNCQQIYEHAKNKIDQQLNVNKIDEDWYAAFFDKAKLVSKEDMQLIWANVLAQEINHPGLINLSLIHALSLMSAQQAKAFSNLSRFCLKTYEKDAVNPMIFYSTNVFAYNKSGIYEKDLSALQRLGLIEYNPQSEFIFKGKVTFTIGTKVITVYGDPNNQKKIKIGNVLFTYEGKVLYSIIDDSLKQYNTDIVDFIVKKLIKRNCSVNINGNDVYQ